MAVFCSRLAAPSTTRPRACRGCVAVDVAEASPELGSAGRVIMLSAPDGAATAVLVAEHLEGAGVAMDGVVLVSGEYARAAPGVAAASSALAAAKGWPVLFVPESGSLTGDEAELVARLEPTTVVGVQTAVEVDCDVEVTRSWGWSEYEVGARIAEYGPTVGLSYSHLATIAASGEASNHCLTVGAYLAPTSGTAVLTGADRVPRETMGLLVQSVSGTARVDFCGPVAESTSQFLALLNVKEELPSGFPSSRLRRGSRGENVAWLEQRLTELSYRPGSVDGVFDWRTSRAVIAFQKWEGLNRDGSVGEDDWWALVGARPPEPQHAEEGVSVEVDKQKQVLLYCVDGVVERTLPVSTGNSRVGMVTPSGTYHIARKNTWERIRYKPLYLREWGYLAIHGYTSVPTYPASHGCVRTTWTDMDELHALVPVGTVVHIY